jgi:hypothetical protein
MTGAKFTGDAVERRARGDENPKAGFDCSWIDIGKRL